jgi:acyl-CoA thioesterase
MRPTVVEESSVRYELESSPWLAGLDGELDPAAIAYFVDAPVANAVHVQLPSGRTLRTVQLTLEYRSPAAADQGPFEGRGRVLGLDGPSGFGQVELRGHDGAPLAYGACRVLLIDFQENSEQGVTPVPSYDILPHQFPQSRQPTRGERSGYGFLEAMIEGTEPLPPFWCLLGCHPSEVEPGQAVMAMPADPWLASPAVLLYGGALASFGQAALAAAMLSADEPGMQTRVLSYSFNFTRGVSPDASLLVAEAHLVHRGRTLSIGDVDVRDAEGRRVGVGRAAGLVGRVPE